ncbi:unnamed protein product [Microthlaspi erraticum]|uniref:Integrase catalytic domain-containing protein n=1 Tax=Microthlaspi erraticum TaxID=1685480 RepID=A0A6D2IU87_9BRAS|nr:unnamed protein product [Microthlaspi erraticum]
MTTTPGFGQVEVSNRQIKAILEKTVSFTRKDWSTRLDEALWAYRKAYKTPIGRSPFNLLYGKDCHLHVEVEYKALWAVKMLNFDIKAAQERRVMNLFELEEIRMNAYENSMIYKLRTKAAHDKLIRLKDFKEKVLRKKRRTTRGTTRSSRDQARSSYIDPVEWSALDGRLPSHDHDLASQLFGGH